MGTLPDHMLSHHTVQSQSVYSISEEPEDNEGGGR